MAKYRVTFMEKIYYSALVEANSEDEAEAKVIEAMDSGDDDCIECVDSYIDYFETYKEETE